MILISIDTLRADHVSSYGYERDTCPRIDAFAERGTLFVDAISPAAWTVPAHATMMTGLAPIAHGLLDYPKPGRLSPKTTTLAGRLKREGFHTAAFTGGGTMSAKHGIDQGFDVFESTGLHFATKLDAVRSWLDAIPEGDRFFLFLHGFDTHGPYEPAPPYDTEFARDYDGPLQKKFEPDVERPSESVVNYVISQYDGEIKATDDLIGGFLDELGGKGLLDEALVVITSDHGEEMFEHGESEHTHSLYDELVRVPLIFVGPNVPPARVEEQVGLIDLFPTILDLVGLEPSTPVQGRSLFPPTDVDREGDRVGSPPARPVFSFVGFTSYPYSLSAVRTNEWKLIVWSLAGMREVDWKQRVRKRYTYRLSERYEDYVELFDLRDDPRERRDVSEANPDVVRALTQLLDDYVASAGDLGSEPVEALESDPEYLKALEKLGYVDGE